MTAVIDIFSLLTAAAGWYYLFYSRAAHQLESIEAQQINVVRILLRRVGGLVMILLGALFFAGFQRRVESSVQVYTAVWLGVLFLLAAIVVLALIDMRLTWKLRHGGRPRGGKQH